MKIFRLILWVDMWWLIKMGCDDVSVEMTRNWAEANTFPKDIIITSEIFRIFKDDEGKGINLIIVVQGCGARNLKGSHLKIKANCEIMFIFSAAFRVSRLTLGFSVYFTVTGSLWVLMYVCFCPSVCLWILVSMWERVKHRGKI